jgi:hypothetical protein
VLLLFDAKHKQIPAHPTKAAIHMMTIIVIVNNHGGVVSCFCIKGGGEGFPTAIGTDGGDGVGGTGDGGGGGGVLGLNNGGGALGGGSGDSGNVVLSDNKTGLGGGGSGFGGDGILDGGGKYGGGFSGEEGGNGTVTLTMVCSVYLVITA